MHRALDRWLDREVALKLVANTSQDAFQRERSTLAHLDHPTVPRLYDAGCWDVGRSYLAMEVRRGTPLSDLVTDEVLGTVARRALAAFASIHAAHRIHGDVSPDSILLDEEHQISVIDFGCSHDGRHGMSSGRRAWLAPEVLHGGPTSPASDVFGLGASLYTARFGRLPWSPLATPGQRVLPRQPPEPTTPRLWSLLTGLLAPLPSNRPTAVEALRSLASARSAPAPSVEDRLEDLFHGPEALLHLQSEPARHLREMAARGHPIAQVLEDWELEGVIQLRGPAYRVDPWRLRLWTARRRVRHTDAPFELLAAGRRAEALEALGAALDLGMEDPGNAVEAIVEIACYARSPAVRARAARLAHRHRDHDPAAATLAEWATRVRAPDPPSDIDAQLGALDLPSERLQAAALAMRQYHLLRHGSDEANAQLVEDARRWAEAASDWARHRVLRWAGNEAYRRAQYGAAAAFHEESCNPDHRATEQASALLNASSAWLEAGEFRRAEQRAQEALELTRTCGDLFLELRGTWLVRAAAYRRGAPLPRSDELLEVLASLEHHHTAAQILLTEAATAWRQTDLPRARHLADETVARLRAARMEWVTVLPGSLSVACGRDISPAEAADLAKRAADCPEPAIGIQALGLLAAAARLVDPKWLETCRRLVDRLVDGQRRGRLEVVSVDEALAFVADGV